MKKLIFLFPLLCLMIYPGWSHVDSPTDQREKLLKIDLELSKKVKKSGIVQVLLEHLSEDGVVLPQIGHPIIGKKSLQAITAEADLKITPPWEPSLANVSNAGDLAYTMGKYELAQNDTETNPKHNQGYYCLIWRRNTRGEWEIAFCRGLLLGKITNKEPHNLNQKRNLTPDEKTLIKTELNFSAYCLKNGIASAFFNFIDDQGIAISSSGPPVNKNDYRQKMIEKPPKDIKSRLQWYPIFTQVSVSGDLGYNFGPYEFTIISPNGGTQNHYGYFMTIWKKQTDGSWKFLFDGGNQSPGPGEK